jgi:hypothetical protein
VEAARGGLTGLEDVVDASGGSVSGGEETAGKMDVVDVVRAESWLDVIKLVMEGPLLDEGGVSIGNEAVDEEGRLKGGSDTVDSVFDDLEGNSLTEEAAAAAVDEAEITGEIDVVMFDTDVMV